MHKTEYGRDSTDNSKTRSGEVAGHDTYGTRVRVGTQVQVLSSLQCEKRHRIACMPKLLLLLLLLSADPPLLLTFELIVEQEKSLFIGLWSTDYGKHPFARVIMWSFGDGNLGS